MSAVGDVTVERSAAAGKRVGALRAQAVLSLVLLAALSLTFAALAVAARYSPVIGDALERQAAQHRLNDGVLLYDGGYDDHADMVLLNDLPNADHSRGGVFFIGDSQSRTAIMPWRLRPAERALIHNYSIGDLRHRDMRLYVQALVEEHDLLAAGGEKVTIYLGMSYYLTRPKDYSQESFVSNVFERHGFYTYDAEAGIHRVAMSPVERFIRLQRIKVQRFLHIALDRPGVIRIFAPQFRKPEAMRLSETWRQSMESELRELDATLSYLQDRDVRVRVIIRPSGTWMNDYPYERTYMEMLRPILAAHNVPLIDQSDLMPDAYLGDDAHTTYTGQMILHDIDRRMALEDLAEMGTPIE